MKQSDDVLARRDTENAERIVETQRAHAEQMAEASASPPSA